MGDGSIFQDLMIIGKALQDGKIDAAEKDAVIAAAIRLFKAAVNLAEKLFTGPGKTQT